MSLVKAPYNFVPLSKKVVLPHWAEHISHDIRFSDSQSGSFQLKIKAHSPIFVFDGTKEKENTAQVGHFAKFKNNYFIPGSSIKGMLRSVLEVMSFSKMGNKVDDDRYAVRDLSGSLKDVYLRNFKPDIIRAGWLRKVGEEEYVIEDCGFPGRISHRELADLGVDFHTYFTPEGGFDQGNDWEKSAWFKYERFEGRPRDHHFSFEKEDANREIYTINPGGEKEGRLVFTGQPGPRKRDRNGGWTGHRLEFIFFNATRDLQVPSRVMEDFFFAYYEHDSNRHSEDWKRWREQLKAGQSIPIFFQVDNNDQVKHLGLSYLYKLPYKYSVKEAIGHTSNEHTTAGIDLSEAIFGYVEEEKNEALKGRVHIGPAKATQAEEDQQTHYHVLSSPKASYYPTYIRQSVKPNGKVSNYNTLMDDTAEIAGWKRYPIHRSNYPNSETATQEQKNVAVSFKPLKAGAEFECTIRYHNLRKIELGALLSAISFHRSDAEQLYHSMGMAKPLGYGKVSLAIEGFSVKEKEEYLKAFEAYMNVELEMSWHDSEQIKELFTMVAEQDNQDSSELKYMELGRGYNNNHFVKAKKDKKALDNYSKLKAIRTVQAKKLVSPKEIGQMHDWVQRETQIFAQKQEPKAVIAHHVARKEEELRKALKQAKIAFIEQLRARKDAMNEKEKEEEATQRLAEKEEQAQKAQSEGYNFTAVEVEGKKAFDDFKRDFQRFLEIYHGDEDNYNKLKAKHSNGILQQQQGELHTTLQKMFTTRSKSDAKNWRKPFKKNAIFKKVAEWVGEEKAKAWLEELQKQ